MLCFGLELRKKKVPLLLIGVVLLLSLISLSTINKLQGNARVVNYSGIVRGATQRLIKQELRGIPNDVLAAELSSIIAELVSGTGRHELIALPNPKFQQLMGQVQKDWAALREEIHKVREGADSQRLFVLSESFFILADSMVSAAEDYAELQVVQARKWLLSLGGLIISLAVLFGIYDARQRKIREALIEAESESRAKGEFLSRMSHEIRTPINGIIGMTAIAKTARNAPDRMLDCLDKIEQSSQFLLLLINDTLDMARIESGKVDLVYESFDLHRLVEGVRVMFVQKAMAKGIDFSVRFAQIHAPCLIGDPLRISQIVINIVSNAMKFTPEGGRVTLDIEQADDERGRLQTRIVVSDTGIGMSGDFLERIFQPFEQASVNISHEFGGTGLGLAISHNLLELMGGEMRIASELGRGSEFTILLNLEPGNDPAVQDTNDEKPDLTPDFRDKRVLLAEDNAINAEISVFLLESTGAHVEHVWNGKEAVRKFQDAPQDTYNLILMDIQMPEMDGLEAARTIRALDRADAGSVPILALTANAFRSDIQKVLQNGMNGHLAKPIDKDHLYAAMAHWLHPQG